MATTTDKGASLRLGAQEDNKVGLQIANRDGGIDARFGENLKQTEIKDIGLE